MRGWTASERLIDLPEAPALYVRRQLLLEGLPLRSVERALEAPQALRG